MANVHRLHRNKPGGTNTAASAWTVVSWTQTWREGEKLRNSQGFVVPHFRSFPSIVG